MQSKVLSKIEKILQHEPLECYIVMVCNKPEDSDEMRVEMTYEGDEVLGCYMLENARSIMDQKIHENSDPQDEPIS